MLKPNEVREIIARANLYLQENPDKLQVFIDAGKVVSTGAVGLSFEYDYTLTVIVQDFNGHADLIVLPLLVYLRTNQPELFENYNKNKELIQFDVEFLDQSSIDLMLKVNLTERVLVRDDGAGKLRAEHITEPEHPELPNQDYHIQIIDRHTDELIGNITIPKWQPTL
ncbi:phage tail protein [Pelistega sp. MC2]|uniref:phage tail protein n=1 Tax=Pelistega sp. MC2 TaxID=1720297 RepID=UPI00210A110F|nr:phage tail protein [Pelistega sp. MC2]